MARVLLGLRVTTRRPRSTRRPQISAKASHLVGPTFRFNNIYCPKTHFNYS